ncbi:MAG: sulfite exporter TauE/SafE family protein [Pseudomonadota bacterium]
MIEPTPTDAPGILVFAAVALLAGAIRGFTGFGGPAFILIILTLFFAPVGVVMKVLVAELFVSTYLFRTVVREVDWRATLTLTIPTLLVLPLGYWLLVELDPTVTSRLIAAVVIVACALMLLGVRYSKPLTPLGLVALGLIAGLVFGGSFIALVMVVGVLLGPYSKDVARHLILAWTFFGTIAFVVVSILGGTLTGTVFVEALPGAASYLVGAWLGSLGFRQSSEKLFRRVAIIVLLTLSLFNLLH